MPTASRLAASIAIVIAASITLDARATAQRTFVSQNGVDGNACSLAAPCRSFGAAIAQTNAEGEVIVQDSAGYGPLTITKSVSIVAPPGIYAGISVFTGDGITINGANVDVRLKGLTINGQGGVNGINFAQGGSLVMHDCTISGFSGAGIVVNGAGALTVVDTALLRNEIGLWVKAAAKVNIARATIDRNHSVGLWVNAAASASLVQSTVTNSTGAGVDVSGSPGTGAHAVIDSSLLADNDGRGLIVDDGAAGNSAYADIVRSTITRNEEGIGVIGNGGSAVVSATQNVISDNVVFGISVGGAGSKVRAAQNTVVRNNVGMQGAPIPPALYTPGDNYVRDNTFADSFNINADSRM